MIDSKFLLDCFSHGLFPKKNEKYTLFQKRASLLLEQRVSLKYIPVIEYIRSKIGFSPFWLSIKDDGAHLSSWEVACHYVNYEENSSTIHLKKKYSKIHMLLGYSLGEILLHESIHAMRIHLHSKVYEESIASMCSLSPLQRVAGGMVPHPGVSRALIISIFVTTVLTLVSPFLGSIGLVINCAALLFLLFRSIALRFRLHSVTTTLSKWVSSPISVIISLTDEEITTIYTTKKCDFLFDSKSNNIRYLQIMSFINT